MHVIFLILISLVALSLLIYAVKRDAGVPWIALLLGALPVLLYLSVAAGAGWSFRHVAYGMILLFVGAPIFVLLSSVVLSLVKQSAITMRSSRTVGIGMLILGPYLAVSLIFVSKFEAGQSIGVGLGFLGVIALVGAYMLIAIYGYMLHAILLVMIHNAYDYDFIIVNGSLLVDGQIPSLLASRLDTAIAIYNTGGGRAMLIPAGGWTSGDDLPESEAMTRYLLGKGIPAGQIVREDQSTTTWENMENARKIIELRAPDRESYVATVTSNYHAYRTSLIARSVGLRVHAVGSATPRHQLPAAILRELAALLWMHKLWHSLPILAVTIYYAVAILPSERY